MRQTACGVTPCGPAQLSSGIPKNVLTTAKGLIPETAGCSHFRIWPESIQSGLCGYACPTYTIMLVCAEHLIDVLLPQLSSLTVEDVQRGLARAHPRSPIVADSCMPPV